MACVRVPSDIMNKPYKRMIKIMQKAPVRCKNMCDNRHKKCVVDTAVDVDMSGSPCWEWSDTQCLTLQTKPRNPAHTHTHTRHMILDESDHMHESRSRCGKRARFNGKTPARFWAWCRIHRHRQTPVLIHENVPAPAHVAFVCVCMCVCTFR